MNNSSMLFAIKCSAILYFAAFTSIDHFTISRSVTPVITKGTWKVNFYMDANKDHTNDFAGYSFTFYTSGEIKANRKGVVTNGSWSENDISKKIAINLGTRDLLLNRLNDLWDINNISNNQVSLHNNNIKDPGSLNIASL